MIAGRARLDEPAAKQGMRISEFQIQSLKLLCAMSYTLCGFEVSYGAFQAKKLPTIL
jgi:hypothetical protein